MRWQAGRGPTALLDALDDAIFLHDLSGRLVEVNAAACQRLGYSRDELLARTLAEIVRREYAEGIPSRIEEIVTESPTIASTRACLIS